MDRHRKSSAGRRRAAGMNFKAMSTAASYSRMGLASHLATGLSAWYLTAIRRFAYTIVSLRLGAMRSSTSGPLTLADGGLPPRAHQPRFPVQRALYPGNGTRVVLYLNKSRSIS